MSLGYRRLITRKGKAVAIVHLYVRLSVFLHSNPLHRLTYELEFCSARSVKVVTVLVYTPTKLRWRLVSHMWRISCKDFNAGKILEIHRIRRWNGEKKKREVKLGDWSRTAWRLSRNFYDKRPTQSGELNNRTKPLTSGSRRRVLCRFSE